MGRQWTLKRKPGSAVVADEEGAGERVDATKEAKFTRRAPDFGLPSPLLAL